MIVLSPEQAVTIKNRLLPERPGPLIGAHVLNTGHGACCVDRWPAPRAAMFIAADNFSFVGDAMAFNAIELQARVQGYVEIPEAFLPLLKLAFPQARPWERVIFERRMPVKISAAEACFVRRLTRDDAYHLWAFSPANFWISKTWGGPLGLAASGFAWGAFVHDQLASVACTFYLGEKYEDIGVGTEPQFRGRGLSTACAAALCEDIEARGHHPSWSTSPDNSASVRVAEKLGFTLHRRDLLYLVGIPLP